MLEYLIRHDLRVRTHRALLGGRTDTIYFEPNSSKGVWAGELFAIWLGKERGVLELAAEASGLSRVGACRSIRDSGPARVVVPVTGHA
jgi:hypothetical protein